jgi:hypothetical protein
MNLLSSKQRDYTLHTNTEDMERYNFLIKNLSCTNATPRHILTSSAFRNRQDDNFKINAYHDSIRNAMHICDGYNNKCNSGSSVITGKFLDDQGIGFWFLAGREILSSPYYCICSQANPVYYPVWPGELSLFANAARAQISWLISNYCQDLLCAQPHLHSHVMLN